MVGMGACAIAAILAGYAAIAGAAVSASPLKAPAPKPYAMACQSCHKPDGSGMPGVFPRLGGRVGPISRNKDGRNWLISTTLFGQSGEITVDGRTIRGAMPPFARLSDAEVAETLTWLSGNAGKPFTADEVAAVRARPGMTGAKVGEMRKALPDALIGS